jgi:hypothetical protein
MMHAALFAVMETMKMTIKLFFVLDALFQSISPVLVLKKYLKMIGFAIIALHLDFRED